MLGAFAVGKTSLVDRFVYNRFHEKYLSTLGVNISQKIQEPIRHAQSGSTLQHLLLIWDIAGFEKFDHMTRSYYRGATGALAVMDLTRPDTADDIKLICDQFLSVCPDAVLILVGNKNDLCTQENADKQIFQSIADQYGTELLLTSAKNGANVDRAFQCLSMKMGGFDG